MDFFDPAHEMPTLIFCALFYHDRGWENESILDRIGSEGIYFVNVSVSASYCIPQCVRLIAGVCTHYVVYNISKKKNTVDKSKIKDKRKVKPKD